MNKEEIVKKCANQQIVSVSYCESSEWLYEQLTLVLENGTIINVAIKNFGDGKIQII